MAELVQCLYAAVTKARFCSAALEVARRDLNSVPLGIVPTMYSVDSLKF